MEVRIIMGKNIFVIIVSYNFERWIDKCLPSLEKSTIPLSIILIDNNSSDNTVKRIKKEYPIIVLFQQLENLGFAKANNIGIKYALENNADYVFLLNQDAWIEPDTVEKLVNNAEKHPEYGILSPIHLTGSKQHFDEGFRNYFKCIKSSFINEDLYFSKTAIYDVDFVNAAAWLLPRTTLENIGGFDTLLFKHYGEDDNYCQRVLYHNMKIGIFTGCTICHDRENRIDKPLAKEITYASTLGDINKKNKALLHPFLVYVKALVKNMFLKSSKEQFQNALQKSKWISKNKIKILESRSKNMKRGRTWL